MFETIDLQQVLVLDIETVPQFASWQEVPLHFADLWELKTRSLRKESETAEEYYQRAGIWAEFGKVVCISVGIFNGKPPETGLRIKSFSGDDERLILEDFISLLNRQPASLCLCAHNGKEFDFPYLCRRMLINGLKLPKQLNMAGKKPWEVGHLDTMELWKFGDYKNYTSLNLLAAVFGIPTPKNDIGGADVGRVYWVEGDVQRISNYCQKDVITTAQLLLRFKGLPLVTENNITIVT
ncbi:3'-5' exonuclease [Hufsiella ginkgonis]|uniref:3'-5' exonuclease n=1 Tax=Hufsiella ginkgonis TaxID=2695274 RepID=A0A7K1XXA0_9SPHI|nr:3'-5' exonuclease [Hufsiella ginkgonis]MXV15448.1 3'-5' exonuclease [Hufsiella ginkgonis]